MSCWIGEGAGGAGTLTIANRGLVIASGVSLGMDDAGASGTLNIDGTAGARGVAADHGTGQGRWRRTVTFDGGILRASADNAEFLSGFNPGDITIAAGGALHRFQRFRRHRVQRNDGGGGLTKQSGGTLTLTAANSYTGGTTIAAGTLQLGNGGASGSIVGDVTDNGALAFDRSDVVSFDGTISGSGSVSQIGAGHHHPHRRQ